MAFYECVLLIKSNLSDEDVTAVIGKFQNLVVSREGTVHHVQKMGKRRLSYELKKERRADYVVLFIEFQKSEDIAEFDRQARLDERIIKSMVVRRPKLVLPAVEGATEERVETSRVTKEGEAV
jgi:small subunit ribosomal protein S6|uniref:Small ribosomal subunit protein bS6 n=1 Tax=Leptospirillum ferriphilum TaxID=178606 RepID=A0A7C3QWH9_9BACT